MEVQGRIWIKENNKNFLGHGKVELLERIAESGSIAKAAREMKMSYKAAWDSIDMMNKISQQPLVLRATGGKGGGGTQITEKGREAIKIFREMEEIQERLLKLFEVDLKEWDNVTKNTIFGRQFMLKTSARNQLLGKIVAIKEGKVNAEVILQISQDLQIVSIITLQSLKEMGLALGMQVYALVKASWIVIFTQKPSENSLQNCMCGEIKAISDGAVNCGITIQSGEIEFGAVITEDSKNNLALEVGQKVWFGFKANDVILGI